MAAKPGFVTLRAGTFGGKRLPIPADGSVRPTTDRARAQAFDLLDRHFRFVDGRGRWSTAHVLDAFAGTGALGFEALSRGAKTLTLWEINPRQAAALAQTARSFKTRRVHVREQDALNAPVPATAADLVFLDPPYGRALVGRALEVLVRQGWISGHTVIYAETEATARQPDGYEVLTERTTGKSVVRILMRAVAPKTLYTSGDLK